MKTSRIVVQWPGGLHLRVAARLVRLAGEFHSQIRLRLGPRIADARSILSIMVLSASLGTMLEVEAAGIDEHEAIQAVEQFFGESDEGSELNSRTPPDPR